MPQLKLTNGRVGRASEAGERWNVRPRIWTTEATATGSGRLGGIIRTCHAHVIVKGPDACQRLVHDFGRFVSARQSSEQGDEGLACSRSSFLKPVENEKT